MMQAGKYLIIAGVIIVVIGLIAYFFGNKLHWFGNLPGDIKVERENFKFYFPITTMILLSVVLSLILYLLRRF
jgi:H+/Cl- antiporter ClcA